MTLSGMTIANGRAPAGEPGGGILNQSGHLTVNYCVIAGNSATRGGGLCNEGISSGFALTDVSNSTFTGNTAPNGFGGAVLNSAFNGGAANCDLRNCTSAATGLRAGRVERLLMMAPPVERPGCF